MAPSHRLNLWRRLFTRKVRPIMCRPARLRLQIESLEDRLVPTLDASMLFNQLGSQFGAINPALTSILNNAKTALPIINQPLSSIATNVQQAVAGIDDAFVQLAKVAANNAALQNVQNALNSAATDAAAQAIRNALGGVAENVTVSNLNPAAGNVTVSMNVVKAVGLLSRFNFGLGLPGIPFHIQSTGSISLQAAVRYDSLTFGLNAGTFFLKTDQQNDELKLTLDAGLALGVSSMTGEIGFLRVTVTPKNIGLHGQLVADVTGTGANDLQVGSPRFVGLTANADLHLLASFVPPAGLVVPGMNKDEVAMSLPKIQTDFHLGWDLSGAVPGSDLTTLGSAPSVALNNVQVGLGSFLGSALAPVVSAVQRATAPMQPVLDFLDAAIPGLSDLGAGKVSLLTLAQAANELGAVPLEFQPIVSLAVGLSQLLTLIDNTKIDPNNDLWINVGNFDLTANEDVRGLGKAGSIADLANNLFGNLSDLKFVVAAAQKLRDQVDGQLSDSDPIQHALKQRLDAMFQQLDALGNGVHLTFPFFEDPLKGAVQLLLGRDADLVSLDASFVVPDTGERELAKFPLFGPISARLSGKLNLTAHFQAGYDTRGLREFLVDGNPVKLVDGLYLDSSRDLVDIGASITASADYAFLPSLGPYFIPPSPIPVYVTASVGIGGTLTGYFDTRLHDPHRGQPGWDGKLRLFGEKIHELFDANGSLSAELDFHVDAYADDLVKLDTLYSKTLASTVLFDSNRVDPTNPFDPPSPGTFGGNPRRDEVIDMSKTPGGNDGQPDKIEVLQNKDKYEVWINEQLTYTYNVTDTKSLTIIGSNDPDNIILHDLGVPVSVDGKDAIAHTNVPYLYPGLNKDTLTIDNRAVNVPYADAYTVTDSTITRTSSYSGIPLIISVSYKNIEDVQLLLAPTSNTVAVNRLPSAPVTIVTSSTPYTNFFPWIQHKTYESHNTITISSDVLAKDRQLNVVGNSGDDHLVLQDQSGSTAAYTVTQDSITLNYFNPLTLRPNFQGTIHFTGLENLDVVGQNVIDPQLARFGGLVGRTYNIESWTPQTALNITGGDGHDTFNIGGGAGQIDPVSGDEVFNRMRISLDGRGGSDSLILNDSLNNDHAYQDQDGNIIQTWSTHPSYSITDQYVVRDNVVNGNSFNPAHLLVNYKNIKDLQVWGGGSNDTFEVLSTAAGLTTTLKGNAGDDVAVLGGSSSAFSGGLLDPVKGPVSFDGGLGRNQLIVKNRDATWDTTKGIYTIADTSVQVGSFQVKYTGVASVELMTAQGFNPVSIASTADGAAVTVHTGKADANIIIGTFGAFFNPEPDMTKIRSTVTVDGGGGVVTLSLGDVELTSGQTYTITDTAVRRSGGPEIDYSGIKTLNVIGTRAADVFNIDSTAAGVKTAITGGFGDNVYNFGPSSHTLDGLQGPVSIGGSAFGNAESVTFFDDQAASAHTYTVITTGTFLGGRFLSGTGELDRSGSAAITYVIAKGSVALFTGQGADNINVQSVGQTISLVVHAGAGDTVVLGSNSSGQGGDVQKIVGSVSILSSGGVASITVDDSADKTARSVKLSFSQDDQHEYAILDGLAPAKLTFGVGPETPIYLYGGPATARPSTTGPANDIQVFFNGEQIP